MIQGGAPGSCFVNATQIATGYPELPKAFLSVLGPLNLSSCAGLTVFTPLDDTFAKAIQAVQAK